MQVGLYTIKKKLIFVFQELKEQLRHEKEHHQQETILLQDMQSQKITALHKKFKAEVAQYKDKVRELEQSAGRFLQCSIY